MSELPAIVREVLHDFIAHCPMTPEDMSADTVLVDGLGMDSLERIEVTIRLEDIFNIEISEEAADALQTVGDLVGLVERLHAEGGEA